MTEKWFEFVGRMKAEHKFGSLAEAMKHASKNKHLWKKGGDATSNGVDDAQVEAKTKKGGKKGNTKKNKTGSRRKM